MKDLNPEKMSNEEIEAKLIELRKEKIKLMAQTATGTAPKNPMQIKSIRKNIARLLTAKQKKE